MNQSKMEFAVESGALRLSDPCYDNDVWCKVTVPDARNGRWTGLAVRQDQGSWGKRTMALLAFHDGVAPIDPQSPLWRRIDGEVGVDSGQAGVFDEAAYARFGAGQGEYGEVDTFYGKACAITCGPSGAGTVDGFGVVSSSGYGDGGYSAYAYESNGKVVGVMIDFGLLPDEDCASEEYDEEEA